MRSRRWIPFLVALLLVGGRLVWRPSPRVKADPAPQASQPTKVPLQSYSLFSGLWRVDGAFESSIRIRNELLVAPLDVTPVLYMADGTEYDLPPVHLPTGGVAVVDVNEALAAIPPSLAAHLSEFGSAELRYQYTSPGHVVASIQMLNIAQSLIFVTPFNGTDAMMSGTHTVEGVWWRRDPGVTGFVSLANVTGAPVSATIQAIGTKGTTASGGALNLGAHTSEMLALDELVGALPGVENQTGGLRVQYSGPMNAVMVIGGLVNESEGYSAMMPFWFHDPATSAAAAITYGSAGLMTGLPDPMMGFPKGTHFNPYFVLRNTTTNPLTVSPALNWMAASGNPLTANLPPITLGPFRSEQVDMKALLKSQRLDQFNGSLNLSASFTGRAGDLIVATGSVDDTGTYVFEVEPQGVGRTNSKQVSYWTVASGFDTMYSLWNPTSQAQDLTVTFYYGDGSGSYRLPVHLAGNASTTIDMMLLIESQQPDAKGNTIPTAVTAGSAIIESAAGRKTPLTLVVAGGTFNVQTATCGSTCINCCGYANFVVTPSNYNCPVGQSMQCDLQATDCNGGTATFSANWTSSDTSVATINSSGVMTGVAAGSVTISGIVSSPFEDTSGQICEPNPYCPTASPGAGAGENVTSYVQISRTTVSDSQIHTGTSSPNSTTLTVTVYHQAISQSDTNESVELDVGTYSTSPQTGVQVTYNPTYKPVPLSGSAGSENFTFSVGAAVCPQTSCTVTIQASLRNPTSHITIQAPNPVVNGQATLTLLNP
jgi:Big-like domain-containing protein